MYNLKIPIVDCEKCLDKALSCIWIKIKHCTLWCYKTVAINIEAITCQNWIQDNLKNFFLKEHRRTSVHQNLGKKKYSAIPGTAKCAVNLPAVGMGDFEKPRVYLRERYKVCMQNMLLSAEKTKDEAK